MELVEYVSLRHSRNTVKRLVRLLLACPLYRQQESGKALELTSRASDPGPSGGYGRGNTCRAGAVA